MASSAAQAPTYAPPNRPKFAFLDEATSALDEDNQSRLYTLLRASGIGFISAPRETLLPFHEHVLRLERAGEWVLSKRV